MNHVDPHHPRWHKLAWSLTDKLKRTPTQKELRAAGLPNTIRTNELLVAAGLPTREHGGRQQRVNDTPLTSAQVEAAAFPKSVQALKQYRYTRPVEELNPLESWMA